MLRKLVQARKPHGRVVCLMWSERGHRRGETRLPHECGQIIKQFFHTEFENRCRSFAFSHNFSQSVSVETKVEYKEFLS